MTEKVFYQDSYQKTLRSEVVEVLDNGVILAATIFYPLGGGQPGDSGRLTIGGRHYRVVDTRYAQDRQNIIHFLEEQDLDRIHPGDPVDMEIDWVRRHRLMRMHTSMHLVCSLIDAQATGGAVGETESRLDFDLQGQVVDKEQLTAGLNALVAKAIPVSIGAITDEELERNPALVRTMSVQPPRGQGSVRMGPGAHARGGGGICHHLSQFGVAVVFVGHVLDEVRQLVAGVQALEVGTAVDVVVGVDQPVGVEHHDGVHV